MELLYMCSLQSFLIYHFLITQQQNLMLSLVEEQFTVMTIVIHYSMEIQKPLSTTIQLYIMETTLLFSRHTKVQFSCNSATYGAVMCSKTYSVTLLTIQWWQLAIIMPSKVEELFNYIDSYCDTSFNGNSLVAFLNNTACYIWRSGRIF